MSLRIRLPLELRYVVGLSNQVNTLAQKLGKKI